MRVLVADRHNGRFRESWMFFNKKTPDHFRSGVLILSTRDDDVFLVGLLVLFLFELSLLLKCMLGFLFLFLLGFVLLACVTHFVSPFVHLIMLFKF